ncbi:hypothetical protein LIER_19206 [Lithospermum erythrorhizon]|uniref:RNase H type-1 domain-containing protein n=1 Tax=Lithospermum erythrorhizon TaxID=34254 RepID=A0AAV3QL80_LITER
MWFWWKKRCKIVFGEKEHSLEQAVNLGIQLGKEYMDINGKTTREPRHTVEGAPICHSAGWQKPREGRLKINCDASFVKEQGRRAIRAIVRNENGEFVGAYFKTLPSVLQVIVAEAMAIREGLELATRQGHLDVELVEEIRTQERLLDIKFQYIRRGVNNVADTIAHWNCGSGMKQHGFIFHLIGYYQPYYKTILVRRRAEDATP